MADTNGFFRIHSINGYISTIYLLEYPQGLLLLDCGCSGDVKRIAVKCQEIGRSPQEIKLAVATHAHPDHLGGASCLRKYYGIRIAAHPAIDEWYQGRGGLIQHKIDSFLANWVAFKSGRRLESVSYPRSIRPDFQVSGGDGLPIFSDWTIIYNPGHTLHDIALFHPSSRTLYWADSICSVNGKLHLPVPVLYPRSMAESLRRLVALEPNIILLAHGGVVKIKDQSLLSKQVEMVLNKEVNPRIGRLQRLFLFSRAARQGLKLNRE